MRIEENLNKKAENEKLVKSFYNHVCDYIISNIKYKIPEFDFAYDYYEHDNNFHTSIEIRFGTNYRIDSEYKYGNRLFGLNLTLDNLKLCDWDAGKYTDYMKMKLERFLDDIKTYLDELKYELDKTIQYVLNECKQSANYIFGSRRNVEVKHYFRSSDFSADIYAVCDDVGIGGRFNVSITQSKYFKQQNKFIDDLRSWDNEQNKKDKHIAKENRIKTLEDKVNVLENIIKNMLEIKEIK